MADKKWSLFDTTTTIGAADILASVQGGINKKFTGAVLRDQIGWTRSGTDVTPENAGDNVNIGTGGLKDNDVITAISLGDGSNTSFDTTNKTIVGALNEVNSAIGLLDGIVSVSTGTMDNDKFVTQGYVDDATGGGGTTYAALSDVIAPYNNVGALTAVNATTTGMLESTVLLTEATNEFTLTAGTTVFQTTADCVVDQDLSTTADVQHATAGIGVAPGTQELIVGGTEGILATGTLASGTAQSLGTGTRMHWYPLKAAFRAGTAIGTFWDDANIGDFSAAFGLSSQASGEHSFAVGNGTVATGDNSFSAGTSTEANGTASVAMGDNAEANATNSVAFCDNTIASGEASISLNTFTTAQSFASIVGGRFNTIAGTTGSWVATEPLFVLGNGANVGAPNNAFTVLKNGNTVIDGTLGLGGTPDSSAIFEATSTTQGVLLAPMTTAQVNAISTPADGLIAYDNQTDRLKINDATDWVEIPISGGYANMNFQDNTTDTDSTGGPNKVAAGTSFAGYVAGQLRGFSHATGTLTKTSPGEQDYLVSIALSSENEGAGSDQLAFWIYKNGVQISESKMLGEGETTNQPHAVPLCHIVSLDEDDYIEVYCDNLTDNNDIVVLQLNCNITLAG